MSLAATLSSGAERPASFLPAVKCSDCGHEIEIAAMGEHICNARTETHAQTTSRPEYNGHLPASTSYTAEQEWRPTVQNRAPLPWGAPSQPEQGYHASTSSHNAPTSSWNDLTHSDNNYDQVVDSNPYTMTHFDSPQQSSNLSTTSHQHNHEWDRSKQSAPVAEFSDSNDYEPTRNVRQAPPSIDPYTANKPFLAPLSGRPGTPLSPAMSGGSTANNSLRTLPARTASTRPRLFDAHPPSPELSANMDCAFPPFPVAKTSRPSTANGRRTPNQGPLSRSSSKHAAKIHPSVFMEPKSPRYRGKDKAGNPQSDFPPESPDLKEESSFTDIQSPILAREGLAAPADDFPLPSVPSAFASNRDQEESSGHVSTRSNYSRPTIPSLEHQAPSRPARPTEETLRKSLLDDMDAHATRRPSNAHEPLPQPLHFGEQDDEPLSTPVAFDFKNQQGFFEQPESSVDDHTSKTTESMAGPISGFRFNDSPAASPERHTKSDVLHDSSYSQSSTSSRRLDSHGESDTQFSPVTSTTSSVDAWPSFSHSTHTNGDLRKNGTRTDAEYHIKSPPRNFARPSMQPVSEEHTYQRSPTRKTDARRPSEPLVDSAISSYPSHVSTDPYYANSLNRSYTDPSSHGISDFPAPPPEPQHNDSEFAFPARGSSLRDAPRLRSQSNAAPPRRPPGPGEFSRVGTFPDPSRSMPYRREDQSTFPQHMRRPTAGRPICRGCGLQIEGKSVKAADGRLTGRWHRSCFICKTCEQPFITADFYVLGNQPYCEQHYHEKNGSLCHGCNRGIEGPYLEATSNSRQGTTDHKYHPKCFTCTDCRQILTDDYFDINGRVYCERHAKTAMRSQGRANNDNSNGLFPQDRRGLHAERRTTRLMMMGPMV